MTQEPPKPPVVSPGHEDDPAPQVIPPSPITPTVEPSRKKHKTLKEFFDSEFTTVEVLRTYCSNCGILLDAHDDRINRVNRHLGVREYRKGVPKVNCHNCHHDIIKAGNTVTKTLKIGISPGIKGPRPDLSMYPPPVLNDDEVVDELQ